MALHVIRPFIMGIYQPRVRRICREHLILSCDSSLRSAVVREYKRAESDVMPLALRSPHGVTAGGPVSLSSCKRARVSLGVRQDKLF